AVDRAGRLRAERSSAAAIEAMATGAAHDLNNPLAVISGRAQLMRDRADDARQREVWSLIAEQAHRASDVITELMNYASPPAAHPEAVDPVATLREAQESLAATNDPQATALAVDIHSDAMACGVRADRSQLREVFAELLANAAAAGASTVLLSAAPDAAREVVELRLSDDGSGMDAATLARALTPFFSARAAGRRLGMGLARVRRYVEHNGGRIRLESRPGEGTTAYIRLPAAAGDEPTERPDE
ncbi:MAG: sensor histidine kinase, partial [Planctomycetota bacterium]